MGVSTALGDKYGRDDSPIRPRPMKPHVARFEGVEVKDLLAVGADKPVTPPFPSKHSLEGEKRTAIAALIVTVMSWGMDREKRKREERAKD